MKTRSDIAPGIHGWILYDDNCGFCRRWIPTWKTVLRKRGFAIAPLQSPWVCEKIALPDSQPYEDLRLLFRDGKHLAGADAYRYILARIWWVWPLALFARAPGTRRIFDWAYRTFADNRHRFSRACGLNRQ